MSYNFPTFKIYLFIFFFFLLIFFLAWLPWAKVSLAIEKEPLFLNFEIDLRPDFQEVVPGLNIVPSYLINFQNVPEEDFSYFKIDQLKNWEEEKMLVFKKEDIEKIVEFETNLALNELASQEKEQLEGAIKKVVWRPLTQENFRIITQDLNTQRAKLEIDLSGEVLTDYDWFLLKKKIVGQFLPEARNYLQEIKGIHKVSIKSWPGFFSHLPLFVSRIKIEVENY
jgi:hypothetical protein